MLAPPGIPLGTPAHGCIDNGLRIMPLGDSLTDDLNLPGGCRVELERRIAAEGLHDVFVGSLANGPGELTERHHEGHSGFRIDQVQEHAAAWISSSQPDLVLLMIGTNDVLEAFDLSRAPERLARLVDMILKTLPSVHVLLATLPPNEAAERQTREFNRSLPAIARARAPRVTLVDLHAALAGSPGLFPRRNCHPNADGHRRIGDLWWSAIRAEAVHTGCECGVASSGEHGT